MKNQCGKCLYFEITDELSAWGMCNITNILKAPSAKCDAKVDGLQDGSHWFIQRHDIDQDALMAESDAAMKRLKDSLESFNRACKELENAGRVIVDGMTKLCDYAKMIESDLDSARKKSSG